MKKQIFFTTILLLLFSVLVYSKEITSWPKLVGMDPEEAKKIILQDNPKLNVEIIKYGEGVTMYYFF
jgi:hypothetical protein